MNNLTSEAIGRLWRIHSIEVDEVGRRSERVGLLIVEGITTASVCWFFHQVFTY